ncbi:MAG: homoserine O-succinyltransferase [Alphaproteobacteria bacterium]|nr:homoserine O-succinyltransferase [Alphaproteobacteria bacterium]
MNGAIQDIPGACSPVAGEFCDVSVLLPSDFVLDSGETLSRAELRLRLYGALEKPVIAVAGGVSASRIVADAEGEKGWWRDIVVRGGAIDLDRFCVLGFDFLPADNDTARAISTADQARALAAALTSLKIEKLFAFAGASYGGMVALAFAAVYPARVNHLCIVSAADKPHPAATALRGVQRRIIDFAQRVGEPEEGVRLARQLAMISYRTPAEFEARFNYRPGANVGDPHEVCDYLIARGRAYPMSAERYLTLSDSVDRHCVDPTTIHADSLLIAVTSDQLAPVGDMRRLARALQTATLCEINSLYGHDAFLKEAAIIGPFIKSFLEDHLS